MGADDPARIRNFILIGHDGVGKTSLAEALLLAAGATKSLGRTDGRHLELRHRARGEEARQLDHLRRSTTSSGRRATSPCRHPGRCDLPARRQQLPARRDDGDPGGVAARRDARRGREGAHLGERARRAAHRLRDRAWTASAPTSSARSATSPRRSSRSRSPVQLPIGAEAGFKGVVDLLSKKAWLAQGDSGQMREAEIPAELADAARSSARAAGRGGRRERRRAARALPRGRRADRGGAAGAACARRSSSGTLLPVLCGSGATRHRRGAAARLRGRGLLPRRPICRRRSATIPRAAPRWRARRRSSEPFAAQSCKTVIDPFAGKLSVFRVVSGQVAGDTHDLQLDAPGRRSASASCSGSRARSRRRSPRRSRATWSRSRSSRTCATGDTLCRREGADLLPAACATSSRRSFALEAEDQGRRGQDHGRRCTACMEEDPALHLERDEQTGHHPRRHRPAARRGDRRAAQAQVRRRGRVLKAPKVPYRETIKGKAEAEGKLKKQTGGHGQFGGRLARGRAAAARRRLRVRRRDRRRRDAAQLHPGGREGRARGAAARHARRLPGRRRPRDAVRRQAPRRRLVRDGVQDRRRDRLQGPPSSRRGRCCSSRSWRSTCRSPTTPWAT